MVVPWLLLVIGTWGLRLSPVGVRPGVADESAIAAGVTGAVLLAVHLWWSWTGFRGDQLLLPLTAALAALGLLLIERLAPSLAVREPGYAVLAVRQALHLGAGLLLLAAAARFPVALLRRFKYTVAVGAIALMGVTLVAGREINGARLWLTIGPLQLETVELLKLALVAFCAAYLDDKRELLDSHARIGPFRLPLPPLPYLVPLLGVLGVALVVVLAQSAIGMGFLLFGVFLALLYAASGRTAYVWAGLVSFAGAALLLSRLFARVGARTSLWLDPWATGLDAGYQLIQGQYALSSGGLFGVGLGWGHPTLVPEVQTDFVLAAAGEEWGLLGVLAILALLLALCLRALAIALGAGDRFRGLLAVGLAATLGLQTILIVAGVTRLLPLTGVPLPFVSYGGSSLWNGCATVGLLLAISDPDHGTRRLPAPSDTASRSLERGRRHGRHHGQRRAEE